MRALASSSLAIGSAKARNLLPLSLKIPFARPVIVDFVSDIVCLIYLICKGTTKNAHTQEKRAIICKKDRFIYLMNPSAPTGSLLTIGCCWGHERGVNRFFANNCERPVVWAALCERTFEVVECPTDTRPVPSKYNKLPNR